MFPEDSEIPQILLRLISRLVGVSDIAEDLVQEGLVLMWQMKLTSPDNTLSWYQRKCWCHLHDVLKQGRSLDSWKRNALRADLAPGADDEASDAQLQTLVPLAASDVIEEVAARDLFRELSARLGALDRALLELIANGFSLDEIARARNLSASTVREHRSRIARTARKLGL